MGGKKTKHRQLWIKSHEPNWNTSPYAIPSGSTSVFLYTSTPFHLHFGWWMDLQVHSECKICENTAKNTHKQTKSGSSWYQHATDDICRCWNSKALYTEDICLFPHRHGEHSSCYSFKTTRCSKANLTKWDPSDNICIQTSRLQNLNPYEHLILISPPSKTN